MLCYRMGRTRRGQLGNDNRGHMSKRLKKVNMRILPTNYCRYLFGRTNPQYLKFNFTKYHQICASGSFGNESDCEGDSGGPVICDAYQVALISYGFQCGTTTPAGYATLDVFLKWFHEDVLPRSPERTEARRTVNCAPSTHFILYLVLLFFILSALL
uniref:Putative serine protease 41 n=1 Tax=Lygus hesperus TaxID=30085 RepID=A0A0A9ZJM6_LYGHE